MRQMAAALAEPAFALPSATLASSSGQQETPDQKGAAHVVQGSPEWTRRDAGARHLAPPLAPCGPGRTGPEARGDDGCRRAPPCRHVRPARAAGERRIGAGRSWAERCRLMAAAGGFCGALGVTGPAMQRNRDDARCIGSARVQAARLSCPGSTSSVPLQALHRILGVA